jgi:hypothetical protein
MAGIPSVATSSFGADTNAKLTASRLAALKQFRIQGQPLSFVVRYISRGTPHPQTDISPDETDLILKSGFSLLLVQHPRLPGWTPTAALGTQDGQAAVANARQVGYPHSAHLVLDIEGVAQGVAAADVTAFANAWSSVVLTAGYQAMLYIGFDAVLKADELFALPQFNQYWSDIGHRQVTTRGCSVKQLAETSVPGSDFRIDPDQLAPDLLGGRPTWMAPSPADVKLVA